MSPERWERLSAIYHAALMRDPDARTPFVHEACGSDDALRHDVLSLLARPSGDGLPGFSAPEACSSPPEDEPSDDPVPRTDLAGRQLGPYRILGLLGIGGMGHVYRARDTALDREVAIKILPRRVAGDVDRLARFDREARVLAALNHPHISAIYGLVEVDGGRALVLELVEGETLAARLRRGPIAVPAALVFAEQIAQALDAAHQAGIVHRDLKPANITIRTDGTLKVLDFGLAKIAGPHPDSTDVPTRQDESLSTEGLVVGTPAYMSPEQARGQPVDRRADIWAFGCVLFEMLTARAVFARETVSDTIAAILDHEPEWSQLPASTPAHVRRLLRRCLAKSPAVRLRDIGDARADLTEAASGEQAAAAERSGGLAASPRRLPLVLAATVGAIAGIGGWVALQTPASDPPQAVASPSSAPPTALQRVTYDDTYVEGPAISPDGTLIAYASDRDGAGNLDIWLQHVAGGPPVRVTTSEADDRQPTFSPDGGQILFRSEMQGGGLYVVPTLGGAPRLVANGAVRGRYSPDGTRIAYWVGGEIGFGMRSGEYRTFVVPTGGGAAAEVTGFSGMRFPVWSPDGRHLAVAASRASTPDQTTYDWWVVRLADGHAVATHARDALRSVGGLGPEGLVPPPHAWIGDRILTSAAGGVWSVQIDLRDFSASGARRLTFGPGEASEPSVARDGLVAFVGSTSTQGIWALPIDPEAATVRGEPTPLTRGVGPYGRGSFSADGRLLTYQSVRTGVSILVHDVKTARVTDLGVSARPYGPVLSPDGTHVAFPTADGGAAIVPSGGGTVRRLCDSCETGTWTSDSRRVFWSGLRTRDIHLLDLASNTTSQPLERGSDATNRPHVSPDDRWLAFRAFDARRGAQVFVAPMLDTPVPPSAWINISGEFERDARPTAWSPRARMIYFLSSRDGFRCLYARPWDNERGQPRGPVQLVRHFHNLRNPGGGGASVISTGAGDAISLNRFVFDFEVTRGDVWTMRLPVDVSR
jgi:eukaryotic-like serine/threonine-protein kinase